MPEEYERARALRNLAQAAESRKAGFEEVHGEDDAAQVSEAFLRAAGSQPGGAASALSRAPGSVQRAVLGHLQRASGNSSVQGVVANTVQRSSGYDDDDEKGGMPKLMPNPFTGSRGAMPPGLSPLPLRANPFTEEAGGGSSGGEMPAGLTPLPLRANPFTEGGGSERESEGSTAAPAPAGPGAGMTMANPFTQPGAENIPITEHPFGRTRENPFTEESGGSEGAPPAPSPAEGGGAQESPGVAGGLIRANPFEGGEEVPINPHPFGETKPNPFEI